MTNIDHHIVPDFGLPVRNANSRNEQNPRKTEPFAQKCRSGFLTFLTPLNPQKTYIPASYIFHIWGTSGTPPYDDAFFSAGTSLSPRQPQRRLMP